MMNFRSFATLSTLLLVGLPSVLGERRFETGALKDFTRSDTEHVVLELWKPIRTRKIHGVVLDQNSNPIANAIFEIKKAGSLDNVVGVKTDRKGRFLMKKVENETYRFKVTFNGHDSVMGTLIVTAKGGSPPIKVKLLPISPSIIFRLPRRHRCEVGIEELTTLRYAFLNDGLRQPGIGKCVLDDSEWAEQLRSR